MKEYERLIAKFVLAFILATFIGFLCIHLYIKVAANKGFFLQTYMVDDYTAKERYNQKSVEFLLKNFSNTTTVYSPLSVENAYIYYAKQHDLILDNVYYVFGNGFQDFNLSQLLLQDDSLQKFTVGLPKADIMAAPTDKLVVDEINAKFNTLSDGKIVFKATPQNVFDYNIYSLCVIDTAITDATMVYEDTNVIQGTYEVYISDDVQYVVIPLVDEQYELILKKGIDLYYNPMLQLKTSKQKETIILPKLTLESVENPSKYYTQSILQDDFAKNPLLANITAICHMNIQCSGAETNIELNQSALDFSKHCIFAIRNKQTKQYVIVGNVM